MFVYARCNVGLSALVITDAFALHDVCGSFCTESENKQFNNRNLLFLKCVQLLFYSLIYQKQKNKKTMNKSEKIDIVTK